MRVMHLMLIYLQKINWFLQDNFLHLQKLTLKSSNYEKITIYTWHSFTFFVYFL